jgi:lysophospholipase L1-like esterase
MRRMLGRWVGVVAVLVAGNAVAAKPKPAPDHWVGTWATAATARVSAEAKPGMFVPGAAGATIRQTVHTSLGGGLVRVEFTNALGTDPLTLGEVHVALADGKTPGSGDIELMSANALTFGGAGSVTIPAGGEAISDPVAMKLPAEADLVISVYVPAQQIAVATIHGSAFETNQIVPGNLVQERSLTTAAAGATVQKDTSWWFLKAVDVKTPAETGAVVAFGDSITDGYASTINTDQRWPDLLGKRLQADRKTQGLGVLNEGIGGNRILRDGTGPNALARFDREVLALAGVKYLVILEGINDIGVAYAPGASNAPVSVDDLTAGITQMAERAHAHGILVYGATLTPYVGAGYSSAAGEQVRQGLNAWIRTTKVLDGYVDFDQATSADGKMRPEYDCGDHLHPNDAGFKAMAGAFDLKMFAAGK